MVVIEGCVTSTRVVSYGTVLLHNSITARLVNWDVLRSVIIVYLRPLLVKGLVCTGQG
jgi:hypothetical protein